MVGRITIRVFGFREILVYILTTTYIIIDIQKFPMIRTLLDFMYRLLKINWWLMIIQAIKYNICETVHYNSIPCCISYVGTHVLNLVLYRPTGYKKARTLMHTLLLENWVVSSDCLIQEVHTLQNHRYKSCILWTYKLLATSIYVIVLSCCLACATYNDR